MKIGILGGTFDPIHQGHLLIAQEAKKRLGLAQVWLMPAACSPFKQQKKAAAFSERFQMVQRAVEHIPGLYASSFEGSRGGVSYTVDTLSALCRLHPQDQFWFLLGADAYADFFHWKDPERILQLVHLVVIARPGYPLPGKKPDFLSEKLTQKIHWLWLPGVDISSTQIREHLQEGRNCSSDLHPTTEIYIQKNHLYQ